MSIDETDLVERLKQPAPTDVARFDSRVMSAIAAESRNPSRTRWTHQWALVAAAATLIMVGIPLALHMGSKRARVSSGETSALASVGNIVEFSVRLPEASSVSLAGSFNGWDRASLPLHRRSDGTWSASVRLPAGRYVYQFVVDGKRWIVDPQAALEAPDDFGTTNSVVTVPRGGSA